VFKNFKKNTSWNFKLLWAVITGVVAITALQYLGSAVDVMGHH